MCILPKGEKQWTQAVIQQLIQLEDDPDGFGVPGFIITLDNYMTLTEL